MRGPLPPDFLRIHVPMEAVPQQHPTIAYAQQMQHQYVVCILNFRFI